MTTIPQLGDQVLSGTDAQGCRWTTTALDGWHGSPSSTLSPVQKTRAPGAWLSPRQLTPRHIGAQGLVQAPDEDALRDVFDRLNAAASLDGATLSVTEGELTRTAAVYRQDEVLLTPVTDVLANWSLDLLAVDPRKYGPQIVSSTQLPVSSGGLTWPVTWPIEWTGVTTSGVIVVNNDGNIESPLLFRIDGPCTAPRITHDVSGQELVFASDYDLPAGSFLLIDMERKTVLEGGSATRNQFITARGWFSLGPGANEFVFGADVYNSSALLTVTTASAYQ